MTSPEARLLRAAIGAEGPVAVDLTDHAWWDVARNGRVVPLLAAAALADGVDTTDDAFQQLDGEHLDLATAMVQMEVELLGVVEVLARERIPYALLKGVATAHLDHADPGWRQFGDVDLLVDPSDLERAVRSLGDAGWRLAYELPAGHLRYTHAATLSAGGVLELDLHQRIGHRALGWLIDTDELLRDRRSFELAGRTLWSLSETDRLIHAAVHMVSSRGTYRRLSSVADVLLLSYLQEDSAVGVVARADRRRVRSLVERSVRDAWSHAELPLPTGWARAFTSPAARRSSLVDHAYLGERRRPATEELAHLRHLPTTKDRVGYLWGLLAPGARYRELKGRRTPGSQLRYLWQRLRSR